MGLIILKLGGSIITNKCSEEPFLNEEVVKRLCKEISEGKSSGLVLVHGAGSYGHPIVKKTRIHEGIKHKEQLLGFAETQALQNELDSMICRELVSAGVPAIPVQASSSAIMKKGELLSMDLGVVKGLLKIGMVPVLYGVPAYDIRQGCSILSGDRIITFLAKELGAERVLHATDIDGVFSKNPKKYKNAVLIKRISSLKDVKVTGSSNTDVTGGMLGKISEVLDSGVEAEIFNGLVPGNVKKTLSGIRGIGTLIKK